MSRIKLKDLTTKIGSGATPSGGKSSYIDAGISLIRSMNVYDFAFEYKDLAHLNEQQAKKLAGVEVFPDDILINITGASVGRCCMVPPEVLPARVNQHVSIIRVRPNLVNVKFLLHYINEPNNKMQLLNIAQGGATREAITKEMLEAFEVELPARTVQDKIASILSAYDDLIENNARRIAILEESAQRLYREWFVHFRFPDHEKVKMVDSEIGPIPKGWSVCKVGDVVSRKKAGIVYTENDSQENGFVPIIDQSTAAVLGYHNSEADHNASIDNPIAIFGDHTCKMQLLIQPFSIGPNVIPFVTRDGHELKFVFYTIMNLIETKEYKRHWNELLIKDVIRPELAIEKEFANRISPMLNLINCLNARNINLRRTRDLLLPQLISGRLDVSELDIKVA